MPAPSWWTLSPTEALRRANATARGLTSRDVERRRASVGKNILPSEQPAPPWRIFLRQFSNPLMLVLLGASGISGALGDLSSTIIIALVIMSGGTLAFAQEYRSATVFEHLRKKLARTARVLRDGTWHTLPTPDLVPGDIVTLAPGMIAPADLRLLTENHLEVDESPLTGESLPVTKDIHALPAHHLLPQERTNMVFSGTAIVQGNATALVVTTGAATEFAQTVTLVSQREDQSAFQKGIASFGRFLLRITLLLVGFVFITLLLTKGQWTTSLLFALAIAVGISPELLPLIMTITLSNGALAMSKKNVLVKRLIAIENLGNIDVMCSDKTGTLTVGTLRIRESVDPLGQTSPLALAFARECVMPNADEHQNPIDHAIVDASKRLTAGGTLKGVKHRALIPFDFERRTMSTVIESGKTRWLITKGAVESILPLCSTALLPDRLSAPLTRMLQKEIAAVVERSQKNGARLIAVARRRVHEKHTYHHTDSRDMELVGFIVASDAPKSSARAALTRLHALGIRLCIMTGDHADVAKHVATSLGITIRRVLTGNELDEFSDAELRRAVTTTDLFAQITPAHKLRIVEALRTAGHNVGFMGDGINDAPALRAADVGISFHEATDVARDAADVILLRRGLDVIADGILEGRKTFHRTMTYIRVTISSNFGNMISVAGAAVLLPFIPLLPVQILVLNLLSDIPMLALPSDRVEPTELQRPQHWNIRRIAHSMIIFGTISSLADYATFGVLWILAHNNQALFRSSWFIESLLTEVVVIFVLRARRSFAPTNRPSFKLIAAASASILAGIILTATPLNQYFSFVPLSSPAAGVIIGIVTVYITLTELAKRLADRSAISASMTV